MKPRFSLLAAAVLAAACAGPSSKEPPPKHFAGTTWQVVLQLPLAGEQPHVRFGDGRMEGFGGCNRFVAGYVEDAVGARAIAIRRIDVPNRHICDADNQAVESRLLETLQSVSTYLITGDTMIMSGSAGSLRFAAKESATSYGAAPVPGVTPAVTANSLVGTRWVGIDPAVEKDPPVFEFVTEQRITGYTGCNMMSGEWNMQNGEIHLGRVVVTKRLCTGPGADAEKHVLAVMLEKSRFRVEGDRMLVTTPEGASYEFKRSRASASQQ